MLKLKAIFYLVFAKRYYLYVDRQRQCCKLNIEDVVLINNDTAEIFDTEIQAQLNVNAVNELIRN